MEKLGKPISPTERGLAVGCLLVPGTLFLTAVMFGLMLGDGHRREDYSDQLRSLLGAVLCVCFSIALIVVWCKGRPASKSAGWQILLGWLIAVIGGPLTFGTADAGSPVYRVLPFLIALPLIVFGFRRDRTIFTAPVSRIDEVSAQANWGRAFLIVGGFLATVGVYAAWPRDPTKTTASHEVTGFIALVFLCWGGLLLYRSKH